MKTSIKLLVFFTLVTIIGLTIVACSEAGAGSSGGNTPPPQIISGDISFDSTEIGSGVTKTYGDGAFTIAIKEKNGSGTITYSSSNTSVATVASTTGEVTITGAGTTIISAVKAADSQTGEATATYNLKVEKAALTVHANNFVINASDPKPTFTYTVTGFHHGDTQEMAISGQPAINCSYVSGGGSYEILISQGTLSSSNYTFDFVKGTLSAGLINQAALVITNPGTKTWGDSSFQLSVTGGSGTGTVSYQVEDTTSVFSVTSDGLVAIHKAGTAQVKAIKQGDSSYNSVESALITITIGKRALSNVTVNVTGTHSYTGSPLTPVPSVTDMVLSSNMITSSDYTVSYSDNTNVGTANVTLTATGSGNYTGTKNGNFIIDKGIGAVVAAPTVNGTPTSNSITVKSVAAPANGQNVEYAISTTSNGSGLSAWQITRTFSDLTSGTVYYVYARSQENSNYSTGTQSSVSVGIKTLAQVTLISVTANGSSSQLTTTLTLTFSQAIVDLTDSDITLSGVSGVQKGTLSNTAPGPNSYYLRISGITASGTLSVAVAKAGYDITGSPKTVNIFYFPFNYTETVTAITITNYNGSGGSVSIPASINDKPVTSIGNNDAFRQRQLTSVTIPNSVTSIGNQAFYNNQLASVIIPNNVTSIGFNAFAYNQLTNVTIPNSVTYIGTGAFSDNRLTTVTISSSVTSIGLDTFKRNLLTSITIPNSVTSIGESAFYGNLLTSVTIPNSVTSIGGLAFFDNRLTSVIIPNSVTSIGEHAFSAGTISWRSPNISSDNQLTSVTIGIGVTSIGEYAFYGNRLTSITIGANVTISSGAFNETDRWTSSGFYEAYTAAGKLAGTYTRPSTSSTTWTKQ